VTAHAPAAPRTDGRPLAVRVLRFAGWLTLLLALIALGIGALNDFDELAKIWAVIGGELLLTALLAFAGTRPTKGGFVAAWVACSVLLFIPPIPIVIALIASQTWPELRDYYRLRMKAA
jgi:hypothetical protein